VEGQADALASALAQASAGAAFKFFRDPRFRRLARFHDLPQTEHDRIFNELVLAWLILIALVTEAPDLEADTEARAYLRSVAAKLPDAYTAHLRSLGVEDAHLADWDKLIAMRMEEYAQDRHGVRAAALKIESAEKDLAADDLTRIQMMVPVQAVAFGCHDHVCRGKTEGRDDLLRCILRALSDFYIELRLRFEGRRILPPVRMYLTARRWLRRRLKP
jgi:hypothetical protein